MGSAEYWTIDTGTGLELSGPVADHRRAVDAMAQVAAYNNVRRVHLNANATVSERRPATCCPDSSQLLPCQTHARIAYIRQGSPVVALTFASHRLTVTPSACRTNGRRMPDAHVRHFGCPPSDALKSHWTATKGIAQ
jgi:hypothetical protein